MPRSLRRCLSFSVAALALVSLGACASDTTAPAPDAVQTVDGVNSLCETQGANTKKC